MRKIIAVKSDERCDFEINNVASISKSSINTWMTAREFDQISLL
jgi:hypothetical protein